jgi:hypothetical protein
MWEIPKFVDFFMDSIANNPNPSTDDGFIVRYGGSGLYMVIYMRLDAKDLYESSF